MPKTQRKLHRTKKSMAKNDSHISDMHLKELIKIVEGMDKTILTPENLERIHQNAQYAREIKEAFQTLKNKHQIFNPSLFKAIMAFAEHEVLLNYSPSQSPAYRSDCYKFISPEEIKQTHERNFEALAYAARHGKPDDPEKVAAALIDLNHQDLLNNGNFRFDHTKNLQHLVSLNPSRASEIAQVIIYLKFAGLLNQESINKILQNGDKINLILNKFKKDSILEQTPRTIFPTHKHFDSFLNRVCSQSYFFKQDKDQPMEAPHKLRRKISF